MEWVTKGIMETLPFCSLRYPRYPVGAGAIAHLGVEWVTRGSVEHPVSVAVFGIWGLRRYHS